MIAQGRNTQSKSNLSKYNPGLFVLNCGKKGKLNIKLDFSDLCEQFQYEQSVPQTKIKSSDLLPQFMDSNEPQMKAFGSFCEKVTLKVENRSIFQRLEARNTLENSIQNDILRPKPLATYCQVCQQHFDDYLQHIQHQNHKKRIAQSTKSCKMIEDLITDLKIQTKRPRSEKLLRFKDEDQFNKIQSTSSKIRVISSQNTLTPVRLEKTKEQQLQTSSEDSVAIQKKQSNLLSNFYNQLLLLQ